MLHRDIFHFSFDVLYKYLVLVQSWSVIITSKYLEDLTADTFIKVNEIVIQETNYMSVNLSDNWLS